MMACCPFRLKDCKQAFQLRRRGRPTRTGSPPGGARPRRSAPAAPGPPSAAAWRRRSRRACPQSESLPVRRRDPLDPARRRHHGRPQRHRLQNLEARAAALAQGGDADRRAAHGGADVVQVAGQFDRPPAAAAGRPGAARRCARSRAGRRRGAPPVSSAESPRRTSCTASRLAEKLKRAVVDQPLRVIRGGGVEGVPVQVHAVRQDADRRGRGADQAPARPAPRPRTRRSRARTDGASAATWARSFASVSARRSRAGAEPASRTALRKPLTSISSSRHGAGVSRGT